MSRLARALLPIAHRALSLPPALDDENTLAEAYDALDGFLAVPVASRYLRATRALRALSLHRRRSVELGRLARRSIDAQLARLAEAGAPVEALRALPADPRAGRRLQALAALLETHRAVASRVRAPEKLRAKVIVQKTPGRRGDRRR
jgi:hypothetical protein